MNIVIYIIIVLVPLILIISPWFSKKQENVLEASSEGRMLSKEVYLQQLVDLEYDYQMGKVSDSDYELGKNEIMEKIVSLTETSDPIQADHVVDGWLAERGIKN